MTKWFVSRHPGALDWAQRNAIGFDRHVTHLALQDIAAGDSVIGSLPVNLAAEVCERGAAYWNLSLRLPAGDRGRELSGDDLQRHEAGLERYDIRKLP
jgi:CRISPR-associated protein Csx16